MLTDMNVNILVIRMIGLELLRHYHEKILPLANDSLSLCSYFAGLNALVPRVIKFCVTSTSAVSEPRTAATTTTNFARFFNGAAFRTCKTDHHRRVCWYLHCMGALIKETKRKCL